jgi:hypothetical protein
MIDIDPPEGHSEDGYPFLDTLLRDALPEIKLALGELIDRENERVLPTKFARLMPETLLVVTLRPDAAEALASVAAAVERELTDSCTRHGSLYERAYRVRLQRTEDPGAPLFEVAAFAGRDLAEGPHVDLPAVQADRGEAGAAAAPAASAAAGAPRPLPVFDPDATRIDAVGPPGWQAGRWVLVVEDEQGEEREAFRLTDPFSTVGRRTDDPQMRTSVSISDAPHVSRRQLALLWEERDGAPGFRVYNLGLNPVHLPGRDIAGAHLGRGPVQLEAVAEESTGWLPPGVPLRIGEQGPTLRVEEVPPSEEDEEEEVPDDPEATRFE